MAMIEVEHLTRRFGRLTAVDDLSFHVEKGEILGFLGPNGAGKSTTMRILTGSLGATEGSTRVGGHDVAVDPRAVQRLIGYLPEAPPLYVDMTVRGYLRFCARLKQAPDGIGRVEEVMQRVGLAHVAHRIIGHLSKGYRQRVGVAQALVHKPSVLILDEPTSGLDPAQRVEIRDLVKELAQGDVTVVLSTHVLPEVEAICDRVLILHQGKIVAQDRLDRLATTEGVVALAVATADDDLAARLGAVPGVAAVRALERPGAYELDVERDVRADVARIAVESGLLELGLRRRGLEQIFLEATGGAP